MVFESMTISSKFIISHYKDIFLENEKAPSEACRVVLSQAHSLYTTLSQIASWLTSYNYLFCT